MLLLFILISNWLSLFLKIPLPYVALKVHVSSLCVQKGGWPACGVQKLHGCALQLHMKAFFLYKPCASKAFELFF